MALENKIKEKIATEVIKTFISRFESFPENASHNRNAPFHEAFLKAFRNKLNDKISDIPFFISLSSWMQGLNTTLGQSFFENIAHHISNGEKREYTSKRLGNLEITQRQRNIISQIIADLSNSTKKPNLKKENKLLFANYEGKLINAIDFSADVFLLDNDSVCAIELKSVKPNSGEMKGEKQKILEGKAALYREFPNRKIKFFIGFPFDPTVDIKKEDKTTFNKDRFLGQIINMSKYFDKDETLIASELWDFLSGEPQTMGEILRIINAISNIKFINKYNYLINNENRTKQQYKKILKEWFLFSELELVEKDGIIREKIKKNKKLNRIYNKQIFDNKGTYRYDRYIELKNLL